MEELNSVPMRQGCVKGTEQARNNTISGAFAFNLGSHYETQQERKALTTDLQSNPVELNQQQRHLILLFQAVQRTSQNQFD